MTFKNEYRLREILSIKVFGSEVGLFDELKKLTLNLLEVSIAKDQELEKFIQDWNTFLDFNRDELDTEKLQKLIGLVTRLKHSQNMNEIPEGLPNTCYVFILGVRPGHRIGLIKKGELGYLETGVDSTSWLDQKAKQVVESMNDDMDLTPIQVECMEAGSMFGWFCPAADPANYDEKGKFKYEV